MTGGSASGFFCPLRMKASVSEPVPIPVWQAGRFALELTCPQVMGIVNVTPDSFSDGGRHNTPAQAIRHAEQLLKDGAGILDLGAESTRPGAPAVTLEEELRRLRPVLAELVTWNVPISVDTYKPEVMRVVLDAGCDIVNDVWALRYPPCTGGDVTSDQIVGAHPSCGVCLMHMHRDPSSMQIAPMDGDDVVTEVMQFLEQRIIHIQSIGVQLNRVLIDPGIGFGKTPQQNLDLLGQQAELLRLGCAVLAGWSRKSTLGWVLKEDASTADRATVQQGRLQASVAAALMAVERGASVVRVHDVKETVQALAVWSAVQSQTKPFAGGKK